MTREEAIKIFGSVRKLADALDVTTQNIYAMPLELKHLHSDRVLGAAIRLGVINCECFDLLVSAPEQL